MTTRDIASHMGPRGIVHGGQLSPRQERIEELVREGKTYREIAELFGVKRDAIARQYEKIRDLRAYEAVRRSLR